MNSKIRNALALSVVAALAAGCASVAVSNDAIEQRTAAALGLERGSFAITDRQNEGVKTTYNVKASNGRAFSCYVTGTFSVLGPVTSDAICNEVASSNKASKQSGKSAAAPAPAPAPAASCNALLKAAGRC